jgi:hypothetical protein
MKSSSRDTRDVEGGFDDAGFMEIREGAASIHRNRTRPVGLSRH